LVNVAGAQMIGVLLGIAGLPGCNDEGKRSLSANGLGWLAWASYAVGALYLGWFVFSSRLVRF
jgi:hypothetical protein